MSAYVAVDWDQREVRVAVASLQGRAARLDGVFRLVWPDAVTIDDAVWAARGEQLKQALRERGVAKADALVTIGRSAVELKQLSLPPAPDDELPDLVRFQAQREFHNLGPDSLFDFRPSATPAGEGRSVLAAVVEPTLAAQVRRLCEAAGLRLRRILLRPLAAASLAVRGSSADDSVLRLLVEAVPDEAEVTALVGREPVLVRTARLPGDPQSPDYVRALSSELRRTTATVQHQLGGKLVAGVRLFGSRSETAEAVERLTNDLTVPVDVVDPWAQLPANFSIVVDAADRKGRYAPLLGALCDEAESAAPALDFLNPRRPTPPPNYRRRIMVGVACAVAVVLAAWVFTSLRLSALDEEIAHPKAVSKSKDQTLAEVDKIERRVGDIDKWAKSDVLWLAELERLAKQLPPAEKAILTQLRVAAHPQGGEMHFAGAVADIAVGDALEDNLRDARHVVEGRGRKADADARRYPWQILSTVLVKNEPPAEPKAFGSSAPISSSTTGGR